MGDLVDGAAELKRRGHPPTVRRNARVRMTLPEKKPEPEETRFDSPEQRAAFVRDLNLMLRNKDDPASAFMISHHRMTDTLHFGPFFNGESVANFLEENPLVNGGVIPLFRSVDWTRRA